MSTFDLGEAVRNAQPRDFGVYVEDEFDITEALRIQRRLALERDSFKRGPLRGTSLQMEATP